MRLTLVYTPGTRGGTHDQGTQDIGRHEIVYALAPHAGDWRKGGVPWAASRLNQPLLAFQSPPHAGAFGKSFSLLQISSPQVAITAVKKAEDSDEIIIRLRELEGNPARGVRISAASPIVAAREVTGQEKELGATEVVNGAVTVDVQPFSLRAFAIKLAPAPATTTAGAARTQAVELPYNLDAVSFPNHLADGSFDKQGQTIAGDQLPATVVSEGIEFKIGPTSDGEKNAVECRGQTIALPAGFDRVYLLAAADGDTSTKLLVGDHSVDLAVSDWGGYIGQWDNRQWEGDVPEFSYSIDNRMNGLVPGYVKRGNVAWYCSHRHHPAVGNKFYEYTYLFKYGFDVPAGATSIALPNEPKVRIFAITVAGGTHDGTRAACPLFDELQDHQPDAPILSPNGGKFSDSVLVTLEHPLYWQDGGLRFTTDGSEPTMQSAQYQRPIPLAAGATIRARQFSAAGVAGPVTSGVFDISDTTPPAVTRASGAVFQPAATVTFSEPVTKESAEAAANYSFNPPLEVKSAKLSDDGMTVELELDKPMSGEASYQLKVNNVQDRSPAANRSRDSAATVTLFKPVVTVNELICDGKTTSELKAPELPVHRDDP